MRKMLFFFLFFLFVASGLIAQDLSETLEDLSGMAAESYVAPIVSGFGTDLNGGWFHKSPQAKFLGLNFELGIVAMLTPFKDEDDHFSTSGNFRFNKAQADSIASGVENMSAEEIAFISKAIRSQEFEVEMSGATIIGRKDDYIIINFPETPLYVPAVGNDDVILPGKTINLGIGGLIPDLNFLPLATPQLSIGTIYGTQLSLRYLPPYDMEDIGEISYMGFGLQHNPKAWLPVPLPVDFCLAFFTQSLDIGEIMTTKANSFGINVSKTFGPRMLSWTPYAGFMLESCKMAFKYDYVLDSDPDNFQETQIEFDLEGENKSRVTLGSSFRVGVFNLNVDYNIGKYNSLTAGFALAF